MRAVIRRRRKTEVNIVPLIDVFIALIFFFLVTMNFSNLNVMNITPPKVETAGENKAKDDILIGVDKEGSYFYNNNPVSEAELIEFIRIAGEINRNQVVLFMADEDAALKHVTLIMDKCRKAGLEKLRLQTR
jgi:biopolymer transport protein ExbD